MACGLVMWFLQGGSWKGQVIILTYTPPRLNMVPEKKNQTPSKGKTSHKSSNHPSDLNEGRETRGGFRDSCLLHGSGNRAPFDGAQGAMESP